MHLRAPCFLVDAACPVLSSLALDSLQHNSALGPFAFISGVLLFFFRSHVPLVSDVTRGLLPLGLPEHPHFHPRFKAQRKPGGSDLAGENTVITVVFKPPAALCGHTFGFGLLFLRCFLGAVFRFYVW